MFIKYSTGHIPPKKSRGKCSQRKKTNDDSQETVDVSEESELEHELVKRNTASRRVVKKKVIISADDNIISDDPDIALELGKSISKTEAEEAKAAWQVHATHARIMTESVPEPTRRRKSGKVFRKYTFLTSSVNDIPHTPPPSQTPTTTTLNTVSTIKLSILKKGEYDIWAMKMEHYLAHTNYPIWEVIQNGNGPVSISTDTQGQIKVLPPRTAEEILARERERKARTTLLMALPEDHLAKFHKMTDAKEMWEAIKSRFGGNDESKKMQKYILKQQFEGFSVSNSEGLHKGYDRFQSLLSQLEIHGAGVSTEDANQKFLRSLPSAWSQVSLIMRTKPGVDSLSFDDQYNNLRVFENDVKGSTASSSSTQNVAFVSENTSSTNDGILLENAEPREIKIVGGEMLGTLEIRIREDLVKRKEDLKAKVEKWHNSSKNLGKLLNTQMSANDKFGLGYGDFRYDGILSYENEVLQSVFMNKESDLENQPLYDRFVTAEGMHVVPPPMTGNYMPSGPDIEIDYSQFTYGPKQSQTSESETQTSDFDTCESDCSVETHESLPEPTVNESKVEKFVTVKPFVNRVRPKTVFHKTHSPFRRPFNNTTTLRTKFSKQKVNTAEVNAVSAVGGKRETAVKPSAVVLQSYGGLSFVDLTNTDQDDSEIPALEEIYDNPTDGIFTNSSYDDEGAVADFTNLEPVVNVSPIPTSRINSIHPSTLILRDPQSAVQTRSKVTKSFGAHDFVSYIQKRIACIKIQKVWIFVDLPLWEDGNWNKMGISEIRRMREEVVVRNKASSMGELAFFLGLQDKQKEDGIFISQDKYVAKILKKFDFVSVKTASTPIETQKPFSRYEGKLSVLVLECPHFDLEAIQIVTMLEKILTGNPQQEVVNFLAGDLFLGNAKSRPLWLLLLQEQNYVCSEIVINPVFHSKTKHIVIRHHFIRDAYKKKLIQVLKIHTDDNVADLLTKAFDVSRESLGRALNGTEALLLPKLFILWLAKVSTDSAKLILLGNDSTAIETLKKIPLRINRSDLLFDDANGIDSLPNQAIFDAIQLMGYEGDLTLKSVPVPLDHFPVNALTKDEGEQSERPSEQQPTPYSSSPKLKFMFDSGGNQGGQSSVIDPFREMRLHTVHGTPKVCYDLCILFVYNSLDESVSLKQEIGGKEVLEETVNAKGV
ncbi:hypothetical protein Tco_0603735, partial [Tanacetum coccineum]